MCFTDRSTTACSFPWRRSIPNGVGEHSAKLRDPLHAVLFVKVNDRLGVTVGGKLVTLGAKPVPQVLITKDFAIEDHPHAPVFVGDGLMARGEVDER